VQGSRTRPPGWKVSALKQSSRDPSQRPLSLAAATEFLHRTSFADGAAGKVGIELEWLVVPLSGAGPPPSIDDLTTGLPALPGGSRLTTEPGGQLELSSPPCSGAAAACAATGSDLVVLRAALADRGMGLLGMGLHPDGSRPLLHPTARYRAMDAYFSAAGPAGRTMMTGTASIQVNLDAGRAVDHDERWVAAHRLGPVLAAAFANSPVVCGPPAGGRPGWRSGTPSTPAAPPRRGSPGRGASRGCATPSTPR